MKHTTAKIGFTVGTGCLGLLDHGRVRGRLFICHTVLSATFGIKPHPAQKRQRFVLTVSTRDLAGSKRFFVNRGVLDTLWSESLSQVAGGMFTRLDEFLFKNFEAHLELGVPVTLYAKITKAKQ